MIRKTMHDWPFGLLEFDACNIGEYLDRFYKPENHPFYGMVCTPFEPPQKYGTSEETSKLFVDCFKDEVFSTAFMGHHKMGTPNADMFFDKLLSEEKNDGDEKDFPYITPGN